MNSLKEAQVLNAQLKSLALADRVKLIADSFPDLAFPTTFSTEDQLITWAIVQGEAKIAITTPLEGALLDNAKTLLNITNERYDFVIAQEKPGADAVWISGKSQLVTNADRSVPIISWSTKRATLHINPLADWTFEEVLHAINEHEVPINPLFAGSKSSEAKTRPHFDAAKKQASELNRQQAAD